ncbi:hypothetical protein [Bacillus rhizoplanae]|uniref:hypothetical protein n=1 Tax=Bacillus rhizoplanae TaxID=2880966 RepID=UPI003D2251DE
MSKDDKITVIMLTLLTTALLLIGLTYKVHSLTLDIIAVVFLLVVTAIGAAIVTERRLNHKKHKD